MDLKELCGGWMDGWRGVFSCMMEGGVCVVVEEEEEPRVSRWSGGGVVVEYGAAVHG